MNLRMLFPFCGESRVDRESRGQNNARKIRSSVMIMSACDHDEVNHGMCSQKERPGERRRPVDRPPRPESLGHSGGEKGRTDILNEMRIEWPGIGHAGDAGPPG